MSGVIIRTATRQDIEAMTSLLQTLFSIEKDFSPDPARQARGLSLLLDDPCQNHVLVAEDAGQDNGQILGMCVGQLVVSTAQGSASVLVEDVVVHESARGRGIGRLLITALAAWAEKCGATRMQLLADRTNEAALDFYQRLGWTRTNLVCLRHLL